MGKHLPSTREQKNNENVHNLNISESTLSWKRKFANDSEMRVVDLINRPSFIDDTASIRARRYTRCTLLVFRNYGSTSTWFIIIIIIFVYNIQGKIGDEVIYI